MERENLAEEYLDHVLITGSKINSLEYIELGILEESGEIAGKVKRYLRGDFKKEQFKSQMAKEMGDLNWYLVLYAYKNGNPLKEFKAPKKSSLKNNLKKMEILKAQLIQSETPHHRDSIIRNMIQTNIDLAWNFGYTIKDLIEINRNKIKNRIINNTIRGQGDER